MNKTVEQHQKDILDKTLFELPCSYIPNHTYENIPDMVAYYVEENKVLQNELEELQTDIESYYSYYAGFAAGCDLSSKEMLNHILKNVPNHKPTKKENLKLRIKVEAAEDALRDIALFLGCGGYNDVGLVEFDPAKYANKIKEAITHQARIMMNCFGKLDHKILDNADKHSKMYP